MANSNSTRRRGSGEETDALDFFGSSVGGTFGLNGEVELIVSDAPPDDVWVVVRENGELIREAHGLRKVRIGDLQLADLRDDLERIVGTRAARDQREEAAGMRPELRGRPHRRRGPQRPVAKERVGYGALLVGLHAESPAILEVRESGGGAACLWLIIEERGKTRAIERVGFLPADEDEQEEADSIGAALLNLFQLTELFEAIEPRVGGRVPRTLRREIALGRVVAEQGVQAAMARAPKDTL